jgi:hypothetical protein
MRVKIRGGTVNGGEPPLCQTCRYATIVRGPSLRDEIVECQELMFRRGRITFPVTYCTSYSDRRQDSCTGRSCATASGSSAWTISVRSMLPLNDPLLALECGPYSTRERVRAISSRRMSA